jgi:hypothetical protein
MIQIVQAQLVNDIRAAKTWLLLSINILETN